MLLILASSSPFRRDILMKLGMPFVTTSPDIDESRNTSESPYNLVTRLSEEKALKASETHSGLIIASDQVATLDSGNNETDKIFNKPLTQENAFLQLKQCSGRTVRFLTGIVLMNTETLKIQSHVELFRVTLKPLNDDQILSYLESENVLNCAGSFKSEGLGVALFNKMEGNDPNSLIGLPIIQLIQMLAKENVHIL
ncbi:nucleoside triphosphate pyrophosphatase [Candidatus Thioglobus sp. NP1]|uniref:Maf family protein n=1 Tax=Candidatus Thioglobus sp. NP1 TaxID=2508687 RepID=UPI000DEE0820|nr:nucleoside triphosphate pyrophosphatase [Candidatus Thioglobus sp. NP1]AXE61516.1 septum formation protein Maf [Candidatus Thioglobus sp. NP1]